RDIRVGELGDEFEDAFKEFLRNINDYIPGNITVRAVDDEDFNDRSLRALEADIKQLDIDFVMIDPFYYLQYEKNTSKTRSEEHTSELQSRFDLVCRLLLEKKKNKV